MRVKGSETEKEGKQIQTMCYQAGHGFSVWEDGKFDCVYAPSGDLTILNREVVFTVILHK